MGVLLVLLSAVCFGALAIFGKLAYEAGVPAGTTVLLRFVVAAVLLAVLSLVRRRRTGRPFLEVPQDAPPGRRRRLLLEALALGAIGYATQATFYFSALERLDAALVALVLYTFPVMVTVAAVGLGRERLTRARVAALVVASAGTALVLVGAGPVGFDTAGVLLALGAAITYTLYILLGDVTVRSVPPLALTTLVMTGAALSLGARALLTGGLDLHLRPLGWLWIGCLALVSTVIAATAFFAGLARVGPTGTSILSTLEPVATAALAAVVLGELLAPLQLLGGLLVVSSVVLVQWPGDRAPDEHDPLEELGPLRPR